MTREELEANLRKQDKETLIQLLLDARDSANSIIKNFKEAAK
jgi:hypothetical protein